VAKVRLGLAGALVALFACLLALSATASTAQRPPGSRAVLAYATESRGFNSGDRITIAVYVAAVDGSKRVRVASGHWGPGATCKSPPYLEALSPNGRSLLFSIAPCLGDPPNKPRLYSTVDGSVREIDAYAPVVWSPDSRRVAFIETQAQDADGIPTRVGLRVLDLRTGRSKVLFHAPDIRLPTFSANGDAIAFESTRTRGSARSRIYVARLAGGRTRSIGVGSWPLWGAKLIAYVCTPSGAAPFTDDRICVVRPDGGGRREVFRPPTPAPGQAPHEPRPRDWGPGDRRLLITAGTSVGGCFSYLLDLRSGRSREFTIAPRTISGFRRELAVSELSRDGRHVLAQIGPGICGTGQTGLGTTKTQIVAIPAAGGAPRVLVRNGGRPDWSR
jgi:WD40-like Beta Propeller Repeat